MSSKIEQIGAEVGVRNLNPDILREMELHLAAEKIPIPTAAQTETLRRSLVAQLRRNEPVVSFANANKPLSFRTEMANVRAQAAQKRLITHVVNSILTIVRPQVRLLGWRFWASSSIVMLLALFVLPGGAHPTWVPLFLLAPLLAAGGVAYAFRSYSDGVSEWEKACPISSTQLLLARLFLIVFYDVLLSTVCSVSLYTRGIGDSLALVIMAWLAPLLALAGTTLFVTVRYGSIAAVTAGMVVWLVYAFVSRGGITLLTPGAYEAFVLGALTLVGVVCILLAAIWSHHRSRDYAG